MAITSILLVRSGGGNKKNATDHDYNYNRPTVSMILWLKIRGDSDRCAFLRGRRGRGFIIITPDHVDTVVFNHNIPSIGRHFFFIIILFSCIFDLKLASVLRLDDGFSKVVWIKSNMYVFITSTLDVYCCCWVCNYGLLFTERRVGGRHVSYIYYLKPCFLRLRATSTTAILLLLRRRRILPETKK